MIINLKKNLSCSINKDIIVFKAYTQSLSVGITETEGILIKFP